MAGRRPLVPRDKQIPFKRNSTTHVALCMMKVARKPITISYLRDMSAKFYRYTHGEIARLVELGYATRDGDSYSITPEGVQAVYQFAVNKPATVAD